MIGLKLYNKKRGNGLQLLSKTLTKGFRFGIGFLLQSRPPAYSQYPLLELLILSLQMGLP